MKTTKSLFWVALLCWSCSSEIRNTAVAGIGTADTISAATSSNTATLSGGGAKHSGTFIYAEQEPGESHRLVIPGSKEQAVYYGAESNSGEGIYFYAVPVFDMEIDAAGNLSFTIGERQLFAEPVTNIHNKPKSDAGFSREDLRYKGRFVAAGIELTCQSETGLCWEEKMLFKRQ